ncbi:helix-turn-helix domain-containing protein [Marinobacter mobilis]|uniref:helix-turn-helix domain-containing protein n=1 Tax=Marinobacter mobilis TaxID=488533 RepID=UPI0035C68798
MNMHSTIHTIGNQVAVMILDHDGGQRSFNAIAANLGLPPRTLRRRLTTEGTSFREIRARVLSEAAIAMLQAGNINHETIATKLGLSDAANFRQAFRRWTGQSTQAFTRPPYRASGRKKPCQDLHTA